MTSSLLRKILAIALLSVGVAVPQAQSADRVRIASDVTRVETIPEIMAAARQQYALGKYSEAYGNFYWAAIQDHAPAQEMLGLMLLYGEELYGPSVKRDFNSAEKWFNEATSQGSPVARFMGDALVRRKLGQPVASRKTALAKKTVVSGNVLH